MEAGESQRFKEEFEIFRILLQEFSEKTKGLKDTTHILVKKANQDEWANDESVSYLDVKQQLLLSYCIDICFYLLLKVTGKTVPGHPVFSQLLELRTVLEKCRGIDKKLKYQIDKLLKMSEANQMQSSNDPLSFRPNLDALVSKTGNDSEDEEQDTETDQLSKKDNIYRAPKFSAMPYHEDHETNEEEEKHSRRLKEKLRRSEILATLEEEYGDRPELVRGGIHAFGTGIDSIKAQKLRKEEEERTRWEEDRFVRLRVSKKEKAKRSLLSRKASQLDTLADVGKFATFEDFHSNRRTNGRGTSEKNQKKTKHSKEKVGTKRKFKSKRKF